MENFPDQTSELGAVNMMLSSIGERPVNTLATSQRLDVIRAISTLNEVNVLVQSRGWWFNEENNVPLTPNADGEYDIDPNSIRVDASDPTVANFVKRGNRLYNKLTFSYAGNTDTLQIDYVALLPFDDLPQTARMYIARRAGVVFQTRSVGSPTLFEFTERDAQEAWGALLVEELDYIDTNLTYAPGIRDAVYNR
jgi:hypothetical protein